MRKITKRAVSCFLKDKPFKSGNTIVKVLPEFTVLCLFGNAIAHRHNDPDRSLLIKTCGWNTNTTRERLNGIPGVEVHSKKGELYLNGMPWDGEEIYIKEPTLYMAILDLSLFPKKYNNSDTERKFL